MATKRESRTTFYHGCYDRSLLLLLRRVCCLCGIFSPKTSFAQFTNQITAIYTHEYDGGVEGGRAYNQVFLYMYFRTNKYWIVIYVAYDIQCQHFCIYD